MSENSPSGTNGEDISHNDFAQLLFISGVMLVFMLFLYYVLRMAENKITSNYPIQKEDSFLKEYGYGYDYVFVFQVYDEDEKENMTGVQREFALKNVIDRIEYASMETKCFYSVSDSFVICLVLCCLVLSCPVSCSCSCFG